MEEREGNRHVGTIKRAQYIFYNDISGLLAFDVVTVLPISVLLGFQASGTLCPGFCILSFSEELLYCL